MGSRLGPGGSMGTPRFFLKFYTWDPRSYGEQWVSSLDHGIVYGPGVPLGTRNICFRRDLLRLPRQDYYRNMFGFWILQLGSWPLSSSYVVFYFCRKSLTCWYGCNDPRSRLCCFPRRDKQRLWGAPGLLHFCSMYFTVLLQVYQCSM